MSNSTTNRRILVVDDESTIADTLAAIFCLRGFDAVPLYSGEAAVSEALAHPPAFLVTDISMAGMNGIEAAIRISQACPECRILLFSGHPESGGLLDKARGDGHVFDVLRKPVHPEKILDWLCRNGTG